MKLSKLYDTSFYADTNDGSRASARRVVPMLYEALQPRSVLDVGCGVGNWVAEFAAAGCPIAHGIDGPWALQNGLAIKSDQFFPFEFNAAPVPFEPPVTIEQYDLVCSFEFAEHIAPEFVDPLVDMFTRLGKVVVLGSAIPLQGGMHHVNEQWPGYWTEKFARRGYLACDFIRPSIWDDDQVAPWYRQNTVAYFSGEVPDHVAAMRSEVWHAWSKIPPPLVHPGMWAHRLSQTNPTVANAWRMIGQIAKRHAKRIIGRS